MLRNCTYENKEVLIIISAWSNTNWRNFPDAVAIVRTFTVVCLLAFIELYILYNLRDPGTCSMCE